MDRLVRVAIACGVGLALSQLWAAFLPTVAAAVVSGVVGMALGWFAVSRSAPNVLPVYRVKVRPDDYIYEREPSRSDSWDSPDISHLRGVPWHEADVPPRRHECWPQTDGWIGFDQFQRCPCGAMRSNRYGGRWMERNSRQAKVSA